MRALACLLLVLFPTACVSNTGPCGTCTGVTACNVATRTCVPAIPPGSACGTLPDGGTTLPCQQGSTCAAIGGEGSICAVTCDPALPTCPGTEVCAEVPAPDGGTTGVCINGVAPGGACQPSALLDCVAPAVCFIPPGSAMGTCAIPGDAGTACDIYSNALCGRGAVCIQAANTDAGLCFPACQSNADCSNGTSCLAPLGDAGSIFCAVPQTEGQPCGTPLELFCGNAELCVTGTAGSQDGYCKVNCSNGQSCPANEICNETTNPAVKYCN